MAQSKLIRSIIASLTRFSTLGIVALGILGMLAVVTFSTGNTYATGYYFGDAAKYSTKGWVIDSGEGDILLGFESSPVFTESSDDKGNVTRNYTNPVKFSSLVETRDAFYELGDTQTVMKYRHVLFRNPFTEDEDVIALDFARAKEPTATTPANCVHDESADYPGWFVTSEGTRTGTLVHLRSEGYINETYELTMQIGKSGSAFHDMSITGDDFYACMVNLLEHGSYVELAYRETMFGNFMRAATSYQVVSATVKK